MAKSQGVMQKRNEMRRSASVNGDITSRYGKKPLTGSEFAVRSAVLTYGPHCRLIISKVEGAKQ